MTEVPPQVVIDALRNEIARLNDERVTLAISLQFANQTIEALQQAQNGSVEHTGESLAERDGNTDT